MGRIPGSIYFDINKIKNEEEFIDTMKRNDIRVDDIIVCYDRKGITTSPYIWYHLLAYGARDVFVLDGGYPMWRSMDNRIEKGNEKEEYIKMYDMVYNYDFKFDSSKFITSNFLAEQMTWRGIKIIDAGSKEEFEKSSLPNSINLPSDLFFGEYGCYKKPKEIKKIIGNMLYRDKDLIFTSRDGGKSACTLC